MSSSVPLPVPRLCRLGEESGRRPSISELDACLTDSPPS